jgi:hypothetical protein
MEISFAFNNTITKQKPGEREEKKNLSISRLCRIYCPFYVELLIVSCYCLASIFVLYVPAAVEVFVELGVHE